MAGRQPATNPVDNEQQSARTERANRREQNRHEQRMEEQLGTITTQMRSLLERIEQQEETIARQR